MTNGVGGSKMNNLTRRSLIITGTAALASGSMLAPAEAATGQISLRILSAGFIFGASGRSGVLVFEGRQYPLSIGGISAGATIGASGTDLVGTASHMHAPTDINGVYSAVGAGLAVAGGRSGGSAFERKWRGAAPPRSAGRLHVLARPQRHGDLAARVIRRRQPARYRPERCP